MTSAFLDDNDLKTLTGRATKSKQIEALRKMGVAFRVNALGKPVVCVSAVEGRETKQESTGWTPGVLRRTA